MTAITPHTTAASRPRSSSRARSRSRSWGARRTGFAQAVVERRLQKHAPDFEAARARDARVEGRQLAVGHGDGRTPRRASSSTICTASSSRIRW